MCKQKSPVLLKSLDIRRIHQAIGEAIQFREEQGKYGNAEDKTTAKRAIRQHNQASKTLERAEPSLIALPAIAEGLLADLWESHRQEIHEGHGGDTSCNYCDNMREAAAILLLSHPNQAAFRNSPSGPIYEE